MTLWFIDKPWWMLRESSYATINMFNVSWTIPSTHATHGEVCYGYLKAEKQQINNE